MHQISPNHPTTTRAQASKGRSSALCLTCLLPVLFRMGVLKLVEAFAKAGGLGKSAVQMRRGRAQTGAAALARTKRRAMPARAPRLQLTGRRRRRAASERAQRRAGPRRTAAKNAAKNRGKIAEKFREKIACEKWWRLLPMQGGSPRPARGDERQRGAEGGRPWLSCCSALLQFGCWRGCGLAVGAVAVWLLAWLRFGCWRRCFLASLEAQRRLSDRF
jgi:hypothetical protein